MRLDIRNQGLDVSQERRELIERKLRFVLGRFGSRVVGVTVHLTALENQGTGIDKHCRIVARLSPANLVSVQATETDPGRALDRAVEQLGPAISRELMRRLAQRGHPAN